VAADASDGKSPPNGVHRRSGSPLRGATVSVRVDTPHEKVKPHHHVPSTWPAPIRALAAVSRGLAVIEGIGIGACMIAVILLATWQFIERNLVQRHIPFFHVPAWTDGVIRHSVFMLGFLGGAYATYTGRHIRIDAVTRVIKARQRMILRIFTTTFAIFIVYLLFRASLDFRQITLEELGEASQADELFTPSRGAFILIFGYGVIAFHFVVQILLDISWLLSKQEIPAEWIAEASHGAELPAADSAVIAAHDPAARVPEGEST
jgi:TRAP-type C4-dicarboxylate transport system permease small subunit